MFFPKDRHLFAACACLIMASSCNLEDNVDRGSAQSTGTNTSVTSTSTSKTQSVVADMDQGPEEDQGDLTLVDEGMPDASQDLGMTTAGACTKSSDCSPTQYCLTAVGSACDKSNSQQGVCTPRPSSCSPDDTEAVCGCDGKTYPSLCAASLLGADIKNVGACPDACDESECGTKVLTSTCADGTKPLQLCQRPTRTAACKWEVQACPDLVACDTKEDCREDAICGKISTTARSCEKLEDPTCYTPPQTCSKAFQPVCGCNGTTYSNACQAVKASAQIASDGPCKCASNADCRGKGQYCQSASSGTCPSTKLEGSCVDNVLCLPPIGRSSHVCGCDGKTYDNSCDARRANVNVLKKGVCPGDCLSSDDCNSKSFCDFKENNCGSDPKFPSKRLVGTCKSTPDPLLACRSTFPPVSYCGCEDGKSYSSACAGHKNRTDVRIRGASETICSLPK